MLMGDTYAPSAQFAMEYDASSASSIGRPHINAKHLIGAFLFLSDPC
jgi:hypothetical protein